MTDETETTETETTETETTEPESPATAEPPPGDATDEPAKLRKEAAGYRRKLRDAEAERDQLRARVEQHDRADVERRVADDLANAADIWLAVDLADLRDDDGGLDADKIAAARDRVLADRPHWRKAAPDFDGGAREPVTEPDPNPFGRAIKEAAGG